MWRARMRRHSSQRSGFRTLQLSASSRRLEGAPQMCRVEVLQSCFLESPVGCDMCIPSGSLVISILRRILKV
jgi:hypothetical protein